MKFNKFKAFIAFLIIIMGILLWANMAHAQGYKDLPRCDGLKEGDGSSLCIDPNWDLSIKDLEDVLNTYMITKERFNEVPGVMKCINFMSTGVVIEYCNEPGSDKIVFRSLKFNDFDKWQEHVDHIKEDWTYNEGTGTYWMFDVIEVAFSDPEKQLKVVYMNKENMLDKDFQVFPKKGR